LALKRLGQEFGTAVGFLTGSFFFTHDVGEKNEKADNPTANNGFMWVKQ
jgi:hypothetical protein